jgi:hypothetical protein
LSDFFCTDVWDLAACDEINKHAIRFGFVEHGHLLMCIEAENSKLNP